jgi:hypothetical protein
MKIAMTSPSDSPPRPRGRPPGSRDTYPRERRYKKLPSASAIEVLLPVIQELVDNANTQGYNRAFGVAPKRDIDAVDKSAAKLLATIRRLLDESH